MSKLYIVATPIGNLKDITFRALEVLKDVNLILSEDTRETAKILKLYDIKTPQISYRDQNHDHVFKQILDLLQADQNLALVSDSGTPLISDPGFKLVRDLVAQGVNVESIPGASAVISALVVSGFPTDKFSFLGFLPKTSNARKDLIKRFGELDSTLIIYESPFRVKKLLQEIYDTLGNRKVCIAKDLTKVYETLIRGDLTSILQDLVSIKERGEYVILVAKEGF
jgi:16S rRNA (cytidine1402-2'-O)-methyltransferase